MTEPEDALVRLDVAAGIATLTLNDPARLNPLTVDMGEAFAGRIADINAREDVRVVVLTGAGRAFSAGGDLAFLKARAADTPHRNAQAMRAFYARFLSLRELRVPIIAAVNGHAIGAGLCVAMACDLRVVAAQAKLGATFVGLGLHPGMGATAFFSTLLGEYGKYLLLSGKVVTGREAFARGMALEVTEADACLAKAHEIAAEIAAQAPLAVSSLTRSLRLMDEAGLDRALWREADAQAQSYASEDLRLGIDAIVHKKDRSAGKKPKKPSFVGR